MICYTILGTELSEYRGIGLFPIVIDEHLRNTEPTDDVPLYKVLYLFLCDCCQWLGFCPLGEIILRDYCKPDLALPYREGA